jgi:molecular chaperone DnaK (HSP70)
MSPDLSTPLARSGQGRVIGIDLGTTNSALAWSDRKRPIGIFEVPQLVAAGETRPLSPLPSFVYFPTTGERESGAVRLPWQSAPETVVGTFARDHGALVPGRQVSSSKSWLSNALVDRTSALLPWGSETGPRISPVDASASVLAHFRDAWNHEHASRGDEGRLERQALVLTVPASFDEEARELTVRAARAAGFEHLTLLEEPLAALYAWIAAHRRSLNAILQGDALILVCDVGGGTTDFSLIRVSEEAGELVFERIAIGEHLLLGGDNLDLTLAVLVEQKFGGSAKLTPGQRQTLRRKCSAAKEQLLSDPSRASVPITILGAGRGVVGGGMSTELTRDEVVHALLDGFLPLTAKDDLPSRDRRSGLRELGLPYEIEPAITKHLAAFLDRAARSAGNGSPLKPTAVLFNGGFFTPPIARERVIDALAAWFGERPDVLENDRLESAVAIGAAFYGRLRQDPEASRRLLIRAGSARTYYVGVSAEEAARTAVCVMPRGTQEGTRFELERDFTVVTNQPAAFTLYSSSDRTDPIGAIVTFGDEDDIQRHAPLTTALRYGKRSRREPLAVRLSAAYTETGTLELWCESQTSEHRWRLLFNLRAFEADPLEEAVAPETTTPETGVVIPDDAIVRAAELLRGVFGDDGGGGVTPQALVGELENALGHNKQAWPLEAIRRLADVLLELAAGRTKSVAHEIRWLNLTGFCVRPGFGSAADDWRISELRKVYSAGLTFPKEIQCQVEWLVLWQRTSAGFTAGQQRELAQRVSGQVGVGQRKAPRLNVQIERESWRLLGGLERLDAGHRAKLGSELLARLGRDSRNTAGLWALSRFGARAPFYGPLNAVVLPEVAERWIEALLNFKQLSPDVVAAVLLIGARTDDPARDISASVADSTYERLEAADVDPELLRGLREPVAHDRADAGRVFGESLPEGLRLA